MKRFRRLRYIKSPKGDTMIAMVALAPRKMKAPEVLFFLPFFFTKSPSGRNNDVEGGVSPSGNFTIELALIS